MKNIMKKLIIASVLLVSAFMRIQASDSAVVSGGGYTLYGSISNTTLSGSVSGTYASSTNVYVWGGVYNSDGSTTDTPMVNGSPYVSAYYRNYGTYPLKWDYGYARGVLTATNYVTTRKMKN